MNAILSMMSDAGGKPSQMRVMTIFVVAIVLGTWCVVSVKNNQLQELSPEAVAVVAAALGAKAFQKSKETTTHAPKTATSAQ